MENHDAERSRTKRLERNNIFIYITLSGKNIGHHAFTMPSAEDSVADVEIDEPAEAVD